MSDARSAEETRPGDRAPAGPAHGTPARRRWPEAPELAVRPGAVLARAAAGPSPGASIVFGLAAPLAAIAVFSSLSYVGAVSLGHTLPSFFVYSALFFVQGAAAALAGRLLTGRSWRSLLHTFTLTYLPIELFFVVLAG